MRTKDTLAAKAKAILDELGWRPERFAGEGLSWAWSSRPTPDVAVRVLRPVGSPLVHVEATLALTGEDAARMAEAAPLCSKLKLHLLAANLEYDFQDDGRGRSVTIADYVAADALDLATLGLSVRRVKDAYYAALVMLQTGHGATAAAREPRAATHATLTTVAVAPETWKLLQDALVPGQTVDELIAGLLQRSSVTP